MDVRIATGAPIAVRPAAMLAQQARWYEDGRCTSCGWMLDDAALADGYEKCAGERCADEEG